MLLGSLPPLLKARYRGEERVGCTGHRGSRCLKVLTQCGTETVNTASWADPAVAGALKPGCTAVFGKRPVCSALVPGPPLLSCPHWKGPSREPPCGSPTRRRPGRPGNSSHLLRPLTPRLAWPAASSRGRWALGSFLRLPPPPGLSWTRRGGPASRCRLLPAGPWGCPAGAPALPGPARPSAAGEVCSCPRPPALLCCLRGEPSSPPIWHVVLTTAHAKVSAPSALVEIRSEMRE